MARIIGIDLGTTNSAVSLYENGRTKVIPIKGYETTPSVIMFEDNGGVTVGHEAKRRIPLSPEKILKSTKRDMGTDVTYHMSGKEITPVMAASLILKYLKKGAEEYLNDTLTDVVITVPAYFGFRERNATREAAINAGWNPIALLDEPTAAAIMYGQNRNQSSLLTVVDLGGGTLDVTVLEYTCKDGKAKYNPLIPDGNHKLGGDDFDNAIVKYMIEQGATGYRSELELKEIAEKVKIELSVSDTAAISCQYINTTIDRSTYERIIHTYITEITDKIVSTVKKNNKEIDDIDRFILVGGSCKHPVVKEAVRNCVGREPFLAPNMDTAVVLGAALYHHMLKQCVIDPDDDTVVPLCPKTLGTDLRVDSDSINAILVKEGTKLPIKAANFATVNVGQPKLISKVLQGNERLADNNVCLGDVEISLQHTKNNMAVVITVFDINISGNLDFETYEIPVTSSTQDELIALSESCKDGEYVVDWNMWNTFKSHYPQYCAPTTLTLKV